MTLEVIKGFRVELEKLSAKIPIGKVQSQFAAHMAKRKSVAKGIQQAIKKRPPKSAGVEETTKYINRLTELAKQVPGSFFG